MFTATQRATLENTFKSASTVCLQGVFTSHHTQQHYEQDNSVFVSVTARLSWHDATESSPQLCVVAAMLSALFAASDVNNKGPASTTQHNVFINSSLGSCFISRVIKKGGGEHLNHSGDEQTAPWRHTHKGVNHYAVYTEEMPAFPRRAHAGENPAMAATIL